jgi:hypothetical protein
MEKKICSKCKEEKELCLFVKRKTSSDGHNRICKNCQKLNREKPENKEKIKLRNKIENEKNKEYFKEYILKNDTKKYKIKYRKKNKEKINELVKKYREKNKEKINKYLSEWRKINKEKTEQYYQKNKEKNKENNKRYIKNNIDKVRERRNKYFRIRRNNDPLFKLSCNLRTLIGISLTNNGYSKKTKSYEILGITFDELLLYFEGLFEDWMSWENYGKYNGEYNYGWDIDHIIPLSTAKNEGEIIKLNHYSNLQPLCCKMNREIKKDNY